jgi:hypothetical protein
MTPPNSCFVEGKKFLWDGKVCSSREEAATAKAVYEQDGFETCVQDGDDGQFLVFTRRVVKQVTVEQPQ